MKKSFTGIAYNEEMWIIGHSYYSTRFHKLGLPLHIPISKNQIGAL